MRISCHSRKTSCQLDTHLNDATPRQKERDRHEPEEQWKQPPTLQHHPSGGKSQHAKGPDAEQPAASVPGAVEEGNDEETKGETGSVFLGRFSVLVLPHAETQRFPDESAACPHMSPVSQQS